MEGEEKGDVDIAVLPDQFDWREANKVSPVKDQQACHASWAFAAIASMESKFAIDHSHGHFTNLKE